MNELSGGWLSHSSFRCFWVGLCQVSGRHSLKLIAGTQPDPFVPGVPVKDICRQTGISTATYYQWKSKYGGLEASELRRVKELEAENAKLKRMYAELALDNAAMKDLIAKKF